MKLEEIRKILKEGKALGENHKNEFHLTPNVVVERPSKDQTVQDKHVPPQISGPGGERGGILAKYCCLSYQYGKSDKIYTIELTCDDENVIKSGWYLVASWGKRFGTKQTKCYVEASSRTVAVDKYHELMDSKIKKGYTVQDEKQYNHIYNKVLYGR